MANTEHVIRYVPTFVNAHGIRTMIGAAQGRNTFETAEQAQAWMDAALSNNSPQTVAMLWGNNPRFEVRPCPCWPVHFDPIGVWFPEGDAP